MPFFTLHLITKLVYRKVTIFKFETLENLHTRKFISILLATV